VPESFNLHCEVPSRQIEFLNDRLYVVRTLVPPGYEAYFRKRAQYRSVHSSTAIEGNKLDEARAMVVMVEDSEALSTDELEVKNLDEAYDLIRQIASDPSVRIDEGLIRSVNSIMLRGLPSAEAQARGKYRVGPSLIISSRTREIRYRPPQAERVPELMATFVKAIQDWMQAKTYPGPVLAALAHFGLISIHPFEDGNGRTARLLADMILQQTGWSNEGMVSVSEAILQRQAEYYESLRATQGVDFQPDVNVTPFVKFHTDVLSMATASLEDVVVSFNRRYQSFVDNTRTVLNARQALGFMFMMDVAPLSSSAYAELTRSSQSSAQSDLASMVKRGIVKRVGQSRNTRYAISDDLRRQVESAEEQVEESETPGREAMITTS
jgi:Fic family protein